jgi:hypothetical protein
MSDDRKNLPTTTAPFARDRSTSRHGRLRIIEDAGSVEMSWPLRSAGWKARLRLFAAAAVAAGLAATHHTFLAGLFGYAVLAFAVDRTTLRATRHRLTLSRGPLPFFAPWPREIETKSIEAIHEDRVPLPGGRRSGLVVARTKEWTDLVIANVGAEAAFVAARLRTLLDVPEHFDSSRAAPLPRVALSGGAYLQPPFFVFIADDHVVALPSVDRIVEAFTEVDTVASPLVGAFDAEGRKLSIAVGFGAQGVPVRIIDDSPATRAELSARLEAVIPQRDRPFEAWVRQAAEQLRDPFG